IGGQALEPLSLAAGSRVLEVRVVVASAQLAQPDRGAAGGADVAPELIADCIQAGGRGVGVEPGLLREHRPVVTRRIYKLALNVQYDGVGGDAHQVCALPAT